MLLANRDQACRETQGQPKVQFQAEPENLTYAWQMEGNLIAMQRPSHLDL